MGRLKSMKKFKISGVGIIQTVPVCISSMLLIYSIMFFEELIIYLISTQELKKYQITKTWTKIGIEDYWKVYDAE